MYSPEWVSAPRSQRLPLTSVGLEGERRLMSEAPVTGPPRNLPAGIVKAIRPRQWVKNLLVLAAPLAALGGDVSYDYRDVLYKV